MASNQKIKAGEAYLRLSLDPNKLIGGLNAVDRKLQAFARGVGMIGAVMKVAGLAGLGGFAAATKQFAAAGGQINDLSERSGLSAEMLSELKFAADQSGASIEDLAGGVRKFNDTLGQAMNGNEKAQETLRDLGLSWQALAEMSSDQRFAAAADALAAIEDPAQRTAAALDLFGKSGEKLIPMMKEGSAGLREMRAEAAALGQTFTQEDAAAADRLDDSFLALWRTVGGLTKAIGAGLAPEAQAILDTLIPLVAGTSKWIKENRGLIVAIATTALGLTALGGALLVVAGTASLAGFAIAGLATIVGLATAGFGLLVGFLASTPGMLAVIAVGAAIVAGHFVDWGPVLRGARQELGELLATAQSTVRGIADAMAAGEIELAAKILWAGIEVVWQKGRFALRNIWLDVKYDALSIWNVIWAGIRTITNQGVHAITDTILSGIRAAVDQAANLLGTINPGFAAGLRGAAAGLTAAAGASENVRFEQEKIAIMVELTQAQAKLAGATADERAEAELAVFAAEVRLALLEDIAAKMREIAEMEKKATQEQQSRVGIPSRVTNGPSIGSFNPASINFDFFFTKGENALQSIKESSANTARNTADIVRNMGEGAVFV